MADETDGEETTTYIALFEEREAAEVFKIVAGAIARVTGLELVDHHAHHPILGRSFKSGPGRRRNRLVHIDRRHAHCRRHGRRDAATDLGLDVPRALHVRFHLSSTTELAIWRLVKLAQTSRPPSVPYSIADVPDEALMAA